MKTLNEILTYFEKTSQVENFEVLDTCLDSRKCVVGHLFIALKGEQYDGNAFIQDAVSQGAMVILSDQQADQSDMNASIYNIPNLKERLPAFAAWFYDDPSKKLTMIGVTGTNGKSSVCHFIAQLAGLSESKMGVLGTIGNGIWPLLETSDLTTIDNVSIQQYLHDFLQKCTATVMEVSSHALAQSRVDSVAFDIAVWTNLSQDHLDYHVTMEEYYQAKKKLFLKPSLSVAIINIDDPYGQRLRKSLTHERPELKMMTYSVIGDADIQLKDLVPSPNGFKATLCIYGDCYSVAFPMLGYFNAENIAAVCALAHLLRYPKFWERLAGLKTVTGRMDRVENKLSMQVLIDFAHTPDALEKALLTAKIHCKRQLWCIFGCGGDRDKSKRPKMAKIAERLADKVILTEDNSRFEALSGIIADVCSGFDRNDYQVIESRKRAIEYALQHALEGDMILVAGKGHECYQEVMGEKLPFNEREIIEGFKRDELC
jgi:UDP-N-acetylmuramoyl-L-alanyl-D-glutamate--2,6-diaminopimelate ligase